LRALSDESLMSELADINAKFELENIKENDSQNAEIQEEYNLFEKEIEFRRDIAFGVMGIYYRSS
jgi:hypothetical protein